MHGLHTVLFFSEERPTPLRCDYGCWNGTARTQMQRRILGYNARKPNQRRNSKRDSPRMQQAINGGHSMRKNKKTKTKRQNIFKMLTYSVMHATRPEWTMFSENDEYVHYVYLWRILFIELTWCMLATIVQTILLYAHLLTNVSVANGGAAQWTRTNCMGSIRYFIVYWSSLLALHTVIVCRYWKGRTMVFVLCRILGFSIVRLVKWATLCNISWNFRNWTEKWCDNFMSWRDDVRSWQFYRRFISHGRQSFATATNKETWQNAFAMANNQFQSIFYDRFVLVRIALLSTAFRTTHERYCWKNGFLDGCHHSFDTWQLLYHIKTIKLHADDCVHEKLMWINRHW